MLGSMAAGALTGAIFKSTGMFFVVLYIGRFFSPLFPFCQLGSGQPLLLPLLGLLWREFGVM